MYAICDDQIDLYDFYRKIAKIGKIIGEVDIILSIPFIKRDKLTQLSIQAFP